MNIALLSPPGDGQLGVSLARGLASEGHDVRFVSASLLTSDGRLMPRARRVRADAPLSRALTWRAGRRSGYPDVVLVIRGRFLRARDVEHLRHVSGAPVVNYYPDHPLHGRLRETPFLRSLPAYDLVLVWCSDLAHQLDAVGLRRPAEVLPFGYDPELFAPAPAGTVPQFDVAFVGSGSPHRLEWLRALSDLRLALTGPRWRRLTRGTSLARGVLPGRHWGRGAARVYWSARVGVNILDPQNLIGHNMRTWELPATGRASVVTRTPDHEDLFGGGGALLVERPEELRGAVDRLLADPVEREAVGRAGRAAVQHGTWQARGRELAGTLAKLSAA
jgi:spore maturation protein CgeB